MGYLSDPAGPLRRRASLPGGAAGFTLTELLLVTAFMAALAGIAAPHFGAGAEDRRVAEAAAAVRDAFIFARDATIVSGEVHGVRVAADPDYPERPLISVLRRPQRVDETLATHPLRKDPYIISFQPSTPFADVNLTPGQLDFDAACGAAGIVAFDRWGTPRCAGPQTALLATGLLTLATGGHSRTLSVEPVTGRVVMQ